MLTPNSNRLATLTPNQTVSPKETSEGKTSGILPDHPHVSIFPRMADREYADLVEDIWAHGLKCEIDVYQGQVLDGSHRYRACLEAGVEPRFRNLEDIDPLGWVVSKNSLRRHLSETQRAMIAAKIASLKKGDPKTQRLGVPNGTTPSARQAAAALKVSRTAVTRAKRVLKNGSPELVSAVENDKVSLSKAEKIVKEGTAMKGAHTATPPIAPSSGQVRPAKSVDESGSVKTRAKELAKKAVTLLRKIPADHPDRKTAFAVVMKYLVSQYPDITELAGAPRSKEND